MNQILEKENQLKFEAIAFYKQKTALDECGGYLYFEMSVDGDSQ